MVDDLLKKHDSLPENTSLLWQNGLFHIAGIRKLLKNKPTIKFQTIIEKPVALGFQDGLVLTYRLLGKEPKDELVGRAIIESTLYNFLQESGVKINTKEMDYKVVKFAKRFAATLSFEKIRELFIKGSPKENIARELADFTNNRRLGKLAESFKTFFPLAS